jgi:tetratricopeptide (TPR) repeat protein
MPTLVFLRTVACVIGMAAMATTAYAADIGNADDAPDLTNVRAAIQAKDYAGALTKLKGIVVDYQQPDVYSLMGYTLRKTGDRSQALIYYQKALDLDPRHKGALEYEGELYIEMGQVEKAEENLDKLNRICLSGCEEQEDLKAAIDQARKAKG